MLKNITILRALHVFSKNVHRKNGETRFSKKHFPQRTFSQNQNRPGFPSPPRNLSRDMISPAELGPNDKPR